MSKTTAVLKMIDLSGNNPIPNLKKLHNAGYVVLALKATEGTTYAWDKHAELTQEWHRLGNKRRLRNLFRRRPTQVWHYHFGRPGTAAAQAKWFLAHVIGVFAPGDRLVADVEVAGVNGKWVDTFWDTVDANKPAAAFPKEDYGGCYFLRDSGVRPHHEEGLWLAEYASHIAFLPTGWTHWDAWQDTDHATVSGESSPVDQSILAAIPAPVKPTPEPAPKPAPVPVLAKGFTPFVRWMVAWLTRYLHNRKAPLSAAAAAKLKRLDAEITSKIDAKA